MTSPGKWPDARTRKKYEADLLAGLTVEEGRAKYGLSRFVARQIRSEMPVKPPAKGRPKAWGAKELAEAQKYLEDGTGYREAARTTGVNREALRRTYPGEGLTAQEAGLLRKSMIKSGIIMPLKSAIDS